METFSTSEVESALWNDRNGLCNNKFIPDIEAKCLRIHNYVDEFLRNGAGKVEGEKNRNLPRLRCWNAPSEGCVKINSDATIDQRGGRSRIRVLVQDCHNKILASMIDIHGGLTPLLVEILAIREGVRLAVRLGLKRVIFEADSLVAI